jgi:hypothetical protein
MQEVFERAVMKIDRPHLLCLHVDKGDVREGGGEIRQEICRHLSHKSKGFLIHL